MVFSGEESGDEGVTLVGIRGQDETSFLLSSVDFINFSEFEESRTGKPSWPRMEVEVVIFEFCEIKLEVAFRN